MAIRDFCPKLPRAATELPATLTKACRNRLTRFIFTLRSPLIVIAREFDELCLVLAGVQRDFMGRFFHFFDVAFRGDASAHPTDIKPPSQKSFTCYARSALKQEMCRAYVPDSYP
jgi:hypothetical protein